MSKANVIKIMFVEDSVEDAEQIVSMLRNAGIAARPTRVSTLSELETALQEQPPDLVMANPATRELNVATIAHQLTATGKDYSLIALVPEIDSKTVTRLFDEGAYGLALSNEPAQLLRVVQREFEALSTRRSLRRLEAALRESERRCDALLDSSSDPIAYVHEGMHVRANHAYLEVFGYDSFEDIEGLTLLDMVTSRHANDFKQLLKGMARGESPPQRMELEAVRADGSTFDAAMEFSQASFEGEACLQIIFRRQIVDPDLADQLQRDAGSGLYHRAHTLTAIDQAVSAAANGSTNQALLLIEPDNWKSVLEVIGLSNIDKMMGSLGTCVIGCVQPDDLVGRLSEHSLGLLLRDHNDAAVQEIVARILKVTHEAIFEAGDHSITMTVSIGGSLLGEKNASTQQLLSQADRALNSARTRGNGEYEIHDPAAQEKAQAEKEQHWLRLLKQAIGGDGFVLYFQQIVSLQDAEGDFMEILLRMQGPNGEVAPSYFLPVAERHGLMSAVDRWVLNCVINILVERKRENRPSTFFVKLAPESVLDKTLLSWLQSKIQAAGLDGKSLVLEMPESKVLNNLKPAQAFVEQLKEMGVGFALEQFGAGLNSFQMLTHINADYLKIDRSFMAALTPTNENRAKIAEICKVAQESGMLTVAEWVEDAASTSVLFACGVDFVQGNFLQEPQKVLTGDMRAA